MLVFLYVLQLRGEQKLCCQLYNVECVKHTFVLLKSVASGNLTNRFILGNTTVKREICNG